MVLYVQNLFRGHKKDLNHKWNIWIYELPSSDIALFNFPRSLTSLRCLGFLQNQVSTALRQTDLIGL